MELNDTIISNGGLKESFAKALRQLEAGHGNVFCISGEAGMGKTHTMKSMSLFCHEQSIANIYVDCPAPIGSFNVSNIQALQPFSRIAEKLLNKDYMSARKKFMKNAGMTLLASLPGPDYIFYAVKELGRDWREYKQDKSAAKSESTNSALQDYFDTLSSFVDKMPMVFFIDNLQWSDAQSIELIGKLSEAVADMKAIFVLSYRKSLLETYASPMLAYLHQYEQYSHVEEYELDCFGASEISQLTAKSIENYRKSARYEDWIMKNTGGQPGVVTEYINYFKKFSPFDSDGHFREDVSGSDYLPASLHAAFSQIVEGLEEDDKNLLSICSAEGTECTAVVAANLMNTDILTAIRKLKHLQVRTNIISSTGAHVRYGIKTTVYRFNQAFYHVYFENTLEYEEKVALHGQIAALLKQYYENSDSEAVRRQIAPYLAAHSSESGDQKTAKSMLLLTAKAASEMGSKEIAADAFESYKSISGIVDHENAPTPEYTAFKKIIEGSGEEAPEETGPVVTSNGISSGGAEYLDFRTIRRAIVDDYLKDNYSKAADRAIGFLNTRDIEFRADEEAILLSLVIKSYIEMSEYDTATHYADKALQLIDNLQDVYTECIILNTVALLRYAQGDRRTSIDYLKEAAQKSISLPHELRILTLANIAQVIESVDSDQAREYKEAVLQLCKKLNYSMLEEYIQQI